MGRSSKQRAALRSKRIGEKPRGFYESPSDEAINSYLRDPELLPWIQVKTNWSVLRIKQLLNMLGEKLKEDKKHDVTLFDTWQKVQTVGMNTGTWVLFIWLPKPPFGVLTIDDIAPDWHKSVFDFELK